MNNVNFQILLKQHNGDFPRAKKAWDTILGLGGYGDVPHEYEGGLDVQGLRILLDERKQKQSQAQVMTMHKGQVMHVPQCPPDLEDRIKKIEDIASGDHPDRAWKHETAATPPKGEWK